MSSKFESSIREIAYPQQIVYNTLSDLSNLEKIKDRIPKDKIQALQFDADTLSVSSPMGTVRLRIIEREEPKCIKFETEESPIHCNLWIQLLPITQQTCKIKLTIKAAINPFMKAMVKKPLQEGIEKLADVLQVIHYE